MATSWAIEVEKLSRSFGSRQSKVAALTDVSFRTTPGSVTALLGVNGAGKTTLTKILSTVLLPSAGQAWINGKNVVSQTADVRSMMSVVLGGDRGLYSRLSGLDNLRFFGMLSGLSRVDLQLKSRPALESVGLTAAIDRRVETYSKGMKQRLHLAIGLISAPKVLLLDEPTVGLDPIEADRLRDSIRDMREHGTTVLLTSHYLLDVERLADHVVVLSRGEVVADTSIEQFASQAGYVAIVDIRARGDVSKLVSQVSAETAIDLVSKADNCWRIRIRLPRWSGDVFSYLGGLLDVMDVIDVTVRPATLEEAFAAVSTGSS